jgi:hypothetical protein
VLKINYKYIILIVSASRSFIIYIEMFYSMLMLMEKGSLSKTEELQKTTKMPGKTW